MINQHRFYRIWVNSDLVNFTVQDGQTDISISAERYLKDKAKKLISRYRSDIMHYIKIKPEFEFSLEPLPLDGDAPAIVGAMLKASFLAGVGPMAAVAGAISEFVGRDLLKFTNQIILENGGDIFIKTDEERRIGIYAGDSPLSGKIAIRIKPDSTPLGICTSSGTVGHSLSFGKADAVSVVARNAFLADSCATATGNRVNTENDIEKALNFVKSIEDVIGAVVIYKDKIGTIGDIELV
ncbi:MAG: thiamine biosynthesis protein ApbE [Omnitrophica bacterium RBG_13_46_9]|nr:MAG: thiamine biosynthesis protein ApbE [Omnitrophica bacterium RBG_13_46_9]